MNRRDTGSDDIKVPVVEEELEVRKRQVDEGAVRVRKEVVETEKQVSVPVREERIRVERHAANEQADGEIDGHTFQDEDIEIPLRSEEVEITKRPVVREHVHASKDVVEREQQASDTVRREEVIVDGEDTPEHADRP